MRAIACVGPGGEVFQAKGGQGGEGDLSRISPATVAIVGGALLVEVRSIGAVGGGVEQAGGQGVVLGSESFSQIEESPGGGEARG